jgi:hypothetical protein
VKHSARRTLEITKLFDVNRRIRWSKHVRRLCARYALRNRLLLLRDWRTLRSWRGW